MKYTLYYILHQILNTTYCLPLLIAFFNYSFSQNDTWIDKNESENYIARHECSFVQAGDTFILFGGRESAQQLDIYDFKTDTWHIGGKAPKEFNHFQATFYEGFVWVIGSFKTNTFPKEIPADYIWLYSPLSDTWIRGPKLPVNRKRGGAGLAVYNNKFYIIGGNTMGHNGGYVKWFDVYNPVKNVYTTLEDAPNARDHFSAAVSKDKLYVIGGRKSGGAEGVFKPLVAKIDVYDFKSTKWTTLPKTLPTPRAAASVVLFKKELFVIGGEGYKKGPAYKLVEAYNINTESWSRKADMNYARHGTQAIASGSGIYIVAGSPERGGGRQHNMEVYNKDNPFSKTLKPSQLHTPNLIRIKPFKSINIPIRTKRGNTGIFINNITIKNNVNNAIILQNDYNNRLIRSKNTLIIKLLNDSKENLNNTQLVITYNGNKTKIIPIKSK